ncbi:hypothetical protein IU486_04740 [Streptomyces gardneri]|nr:hypothetical protein [Streptomyces gardneri]
MRTAGTGDNRHDDGPGLGRTPRFEAGAFVVSGAGITLYLLTVNQNTFGRGHVAKVISLSNQLGLLTIDRITVTVRYAWFALRVAICMLL